MKILLISSHDIWGSLDTFSPMKRIMLYLAEKNEKIVFMGLDKNVHNDESSRLYGEPVKFIHENVTIVRHKILDNAFFHKLTKIRILRRILRKLRYDILFPRICYREGKKIIDDIDLVYAYEVGAVATAKKLSLKYNKPLVTRFQGTFLYELINKHGMRYCERKYGMHLDALKTKADLIIMTDDGTQGDRMMRALENDEHMKFWKNGFDFEPMQESKEELRKRLGLSSDTFYTISVSRLSGWKRLERIIEAYRVISKSGRNIKHIFVGEGETREYLTGLINEYGLQSYFVFAGDVPHKDVPQYLQSADIFFSFFDSTNIGNPLQEALKLHLPIVTYDVGDTAVMINGKNGVLLDGYEPEKIAGAVYRILDDNEYREGLIENAAKTGDALWTWEQRLSAEYEQLAGLLCEENQRKV